MGLATVGDLARQEPAALERRLGPSGRDLWELAQRIDPRPVVPDREAKSIGAEETFEEDLAGVEALRAAPPRPGAAGRRAGCGARALRARTVQLKLKLADFTLVTRRATLDAPTDDGQALYRDGGGAARARARRARPA